jgi:THAP domain
MFIFSGIPTNQTANVFFSLIKWMNFSQHPDFITNKATSVEEVISQVKSRRYIICSSHFVEVDFKIWKDGKRHLRDGAMPSLYGSLLNDSFGAEVSPIRPPKDKRAARLQGLLQGVSNNTDHSEDSLEDRDSAGVLSEIEARFEGNNSNLDILNECISMGSNAGTDLQILS